MANFRCFVSLEGKEITVVPVLECGELISYTIPSFSVLTVNLRRIKYQCTVPDETGAPIIKIVDGFIKDDVSLKRSYPAEAAISSHDHHACLIEVGGFNFLIQLIFMIII